MKTERIEVRLSESEAAALDKIAKKAKLSCSEVIRRLILNCRIIEAPPADYYTLITNLRNVGSKINQLINVAYSQNNVDVSLLKNTLEDYRKTEHMIWESFSRDAS